MNKDRKPGWYRVKYKSKWKFVQYEHGVWFMGGGSYRDYDFTEINETMINPEP